MCNILGRLQHTSDMDTQHNLDCATPTITLDKPHQQNETRSQYFRERYINMAPKERKARREQQRLSYRETGQKEAIIAGVKRQRELQKHTLHHESIAMENPLFIPELVWPTAGASGAHGTMTKSSDWIIPESTSATPLYIPPPHEEVDDEGCDELLLAI